MELDRLEKTPGTAEKELTLQISSDTVHATDKQEPLTTILIPMESRVVYYCESERI